MKVTKQIWEQIQRINRMQPCNPSKITFFFFFAKQQTRFKLNKVRICIVKLYKQFPLNFSMIKKKKRKKDRTYLERQSVSFNVEQSHIPWILKCEPHFSQEPRPLALTAQCAWQKDGCGGLTESRSPAQRSSLGLSNSSQTLTSDSSFPVTTTLLTGGWGSLNNSWEEIQF